MRRDNTSGFIGVTLRRRDSRWVAKIKVDKIELWLGSFDSAEAAAAARRQAEQIYWGRP